LQTIFEICANTRFLGRIVRSSRFFSPPATPWVGLGFLSRPGKGRPGSADSHKARPGLGPARTHPSERPDRPDPVHTAWSTTAHTRLGPARPPGPERPFLLQGGSPSARSQPPAERPRKPSLRDPPRARRAKPALTSINHAMLHDARPTASSPRTHPFSRIDPACQLAHRRAVAHTRAQAAPTH
jgi:hypothetical protein